MNTRVATPRSSAGPSARQPGRSPVLVAVANDLRTRDLRRHGCRLIELVKRSGLNDERAEADKAWREAFRYVRREGPEKPRSSGCTRKSSAGPRRRDLAFVT
jgi:hypothetical protein